jgi:predicted nucleic acid-binding protein
VIEYLFDSNILIYHLNGQLNKQGTDLLAIGLAGKGAYSIISKIELLGFKQTESQDQQARLLLSSLHELELNSMIAEQTIQIRKSRKLKLPDAVIASTAIVHKLKLITRNTSDFNCIEGLDFINPFT